MLLRQSYGKTLNDLDLYIYVKLYCKCMESFLHACVLSNNNLTEKLLLVFYRTKIKKTKHLVHCIACKNVL